MTIAKRTSLLRLGCPLIGGRRPRRRSVSWRPELRSSFDWPRCCQSQSSPFRASDFAMTGVEVNAPTLFHRVACGFRLSRLYSRSTACAVPNWRRQNVRTYRARLDQPPSTRPRHSCHGQIFTWERPSLFRHAQHSTLPITSFLGIGSGSGKARKKRRSRTFPQPFSVGGKRSRAVPAKYGQFSMFTGRDWVLLRLEPDAGHRCLGGDPNIGWVRLAP